VDDKKLQRMLIQNFISNNRINTLHAENGSQAVDMVNNNDVDLIFMDSHMPIMNGVESAKIIKKSHPFIPIIALTGEADQNEIEKISIVMDSYLKKPISKLHLLQNLDQWLWKI
jgi:two-component system autoinducer 1 sensor kinase/phosphatase LuxN